MINTKIHFNYGCMNSGKSLELMRIAYNYEENNIYPLILKPKIDTRRVGKIFSRVGLEKEAYEIDDNTDFDELIQANTKVILIDESQFLKTNQVDKIIEKTYEHNIKTIIFFGLKNDFRGELFEASKRIIEYSDNIEEGTSVCFCGKKARQNARVINGEVKKTGPTIIIDDKKTKIDYVPLCNYHFYKGVWHDKENKKI